MSALMRLFVALPVEHGVRHRLATEVGRWRSDRGAGTGDDDGWRWTRPEGWHVTLAFLGAVDPDRADDAALAAGEAAAGTGTIELRLGGLGRFGRGVLHVAVEDRPTGAVADLGARVQQSLVAAEVPVQVREVRPHLTLARARRRSRPRMPALVPPEASWTVEEAHLYASRPGPGGAVYDLIERLPLA